MLFASGQPIEPASVRVAPHFIAGNGYDSGGARSAIAPKANIIGLKALDGEGKGRISSIIAALDWAIVNRAKYNIRVINMSLGAGVFESYNTDPLTRAAKRAVDAGLIGRLVHVRALAGHAEGAPVLLGGPVQAAAAFPREAVTVAVKVIRVRAGHPIRETRIRVGGTVPFPAVAVVVGRAGLPAW